MSKRIRLISVLLVVFLVCLVIGMKFLNGDSLSLSNKDETESSVVTEVVDVSQTNHDSIDVQEKIDDFLDHDAHIRFIGYDNSYIYIVDDHYGTYLSTKDITSGINSEIRTLHKDFRGGIDYLAYNTTYGRYYVIYDTYYYEVRDLNKDMYKQFTLHEKFRGGEYYFTTNCYIYMISPDKKSVRRTTDLSKATDYYEFELPEEIQDGNEYFGWNGRFYVVGLPSNTVRSFTSLETLEDPQEHVYSKQIQDYLPYHNYSGHWEQVWDYVDVTSQKEITTTYQIGVEMSTDDGTSYQPTNLEEIKRAEIHFYLSKVGRSLQTTKEIWSPIHEENEQESIEPTQHITKWQWVITYDNYRQSKQYKVYTDVFRQTKGELPKIPLNSKLKIPPISALPAGKPDHGTVKLSWHKAHAKESTQHFKYNIYRSEFKDGDKTLLTKNPISKLSYEDTTMEDEKIYYYWIKTVNENGTVSPYSEPSEPVYVDTINKITFLATANTITQPDSFEQESQSESSSEGVEEPVLVINDAYWGNDGVNIFKLYQSNADGSNQELLIGGSIGTYAYSPNGLYIAYTARHVSSDNNAYLNFMDVNKKKFWRPKKYKDYPDIRNLCWKSPRMEDISLHFLSKGQYSIYSNDSRYIVNGKMYHDTDFLGRLDTPHMHKFMDISYWGGSIGTMFDEDLKKIVLRYFNIAGQGSYGDIIDDTVDYRTTLTSSVYKDLIFYSAKKDGDYDIYGYGAKEDGVHNSHGYSAPHEIFKGTDNDVDDKFPVLSPDGTKVAYISEVNGESVLCVMDVICDHNNEYGHNVNSSCVNHRILVENVESVEPVWMPNSKAIIYSAHKEVLGDYYYTSNLDTYLYLYSLEHKDSVQISQENRKSISPQLVPHRYEAENAMIDNAEISYKKEASNSYTVGKIDSEDSFVEFTVNVPVDFDNYHVQVAYFNGWSEESTHIIHVKDVRPFHVTYDNTGWDTLGVTDFSVPLKAGENKIRFTKGENYADIDYILVLGKGEK